MDRRTGPGGLPWRNAPAAVAVAAVASIAGITAAYTASMNPRVPGAISFGVTSVRSTAAGPDQSRPGASTAAPLNEPSTGGPASDTGAGTPGLVDGGAALAVTAPLVGHPAPAPTRSGSTVAGPGGPAASGSTSATPPTTQGSSGIHSVVSVPAGAIGGGSGSSPTTVVTTPTVASVPAANVTVPAASATPSTTVPVPAATTQTDTAATGKSGNGKGGKGSGNGKNGNQNGNQNGKGSVPPSVVSPDYPVVQAESAADSSPTGDSLPSAGPTSQKGR